MQTVFLRKLLEIPVKAKICIYGVGQGGTQLRERLAKVRPDITVVCFMDSFKRGKKDGIEVFLPDDLPRIADRLDELLVASVHWPEITNKLSDAGLRRVWIALMSPPPTSRAGIKTLLRAPLTALLRTPIRWLFDLALHVAARREGRRAPREKPRIFWGPSPLINIKYHSRAVKNLGYESATVVSQIYHINTRADFDHTTQEVADGFRLYRWLPTNFKGLLNQHFVFLWAIRKFDIFHFYVDGGLLRSTPLKYREFQLLHLANKRVIITCYGGDVQAISRSRNLLFKHAQNCDYPACVRAESQILRDIDYCVQHADFILAGVDWVDFLPYWDMLICGHFAIDTEEWISVPRGPRAPGDPLVVFHAPNHRELKGTRFLIRACEELRAEGVPIELRLVEGVKNSEIHRIMADCDVVADQFIVGWYALFALEGMSMAKPVLTFLRQDLVELYSLFSWAAECPIVNTPALQIKESLRRLAADPDLCARLGAAGREYVVKNHSLESVGQIFDKIYRRFWCMPERAD